jgi:hypothetical protein
MNTLILVTNDYPYEVNGAAYVRRQTDFVVDGLGLGQRLAFEPNRPWIGETCFELQSEACAREVESLRGLRAPWNQFGTPRFALYRCHCGCDYCGIFSCIIRRTDETVTWEDLRYEDGSRDDDDPCESDRGHSYTQQITSFTFDVTAYDSAIHRLIAER